ncbi:MAG: methyltransferase domain-containing protein [Balneolaceae bacterium]|nr:methyltransferase domain-containing protein [Balneolaceae bacterium]
MPAVIKWPSSGCRLRENAYKEFIMMNSEVSKYSGLDIEGAINYDDSVKPDYTWDGLKMPFQSNLFDCAIATEVLEHCPDPDIILNEVFRVLKNQSHLFLTIPFLWPLHEVPNDQYRYTPFSLQKHLEEAGFAEIKIRPLGGWHAAMAQMLGLWVIRAPFSLMQRRFLKLLAIPFYKYLVKIDTKPKTFTEGSMITGLAAVAYKNDYTIKVDEVSKQ